MSSSRMLTGIANNNTEATLPRWIEIGGIETGKESYPVIMEKTVALQSAAVNGSPEFTVGYRKYLKTTAPPDFT